MAVSIFVGDVLVSQVIIFESAAQQIAVLNRYWKVTSNLVPGVVTFAEVALNIDSLVSAMYKPLIANVASYMGIRVRRVNPAVPHDAWGVSTSGAGAGTAGAAALPTQTCGLIRFRDAFIGKGHEGRQYLPFPSVSDNQSTGKPAATYVTAATALAVQLATQLDVAPGGGGEFLIDPILWNITNPFPVRTLVSGTAAPSWATQRRRGSFGRFNVPPF